MKIKKINPIAKALLSLKKRVVPSKKGKGSYNRKRRRTLQSKYNEQTFEKISVKKTIKKQKRDDWKKERRLLRKHKNIRQEKFFA